MKLAVFLSPHVGLYFSAMFAAVTFHLNLTEIFAVRKLGY